MLDKRPLPTTILMFLFLVNAEGTLPASLGRLCIAITAALLANIPAAFAFLDGPRLDNEPYLKGMQLHALSLTDAKGSVFCQGVLVAPNYALTAAHCLWGRNPSDVRIRAAMNATGSKHESIRVKKWALAASDKHQEDANFLASDFADYAVVQLASRPQRASPIRLLRPLSRTALQDNASNIYLIGWQHPNFELGATQSFGSVRRVREFERKSYIRLILDDVRLMCKGDSGGPVVLRRPGQAGPVFYLLGLNSAIVRDFMEGPPNSRDWDDKAKTEVPRCGRQAIVVNTSLLLDEVLSNAASLSPDAKALLGAQIHSLQDMP